MNNTRPQFSLSAAETKILEEVAPGLAAVLNDRFRTIETRVQAQRGQRGTVHRANEMRLASKQIRNVPDPTEPGDAVNLGTLKRFRTCEYIVSQMDRCMDLEDFVDGDTATVNVLAEAGYFFGYTIRPPESLTTSGMGANKTLVAWPFVLPFAISVSKVTIEVTTASNTTEIGLYDDSGSLVFNSGQINTASTGRKTGTLSSPVELSAGFYTLVIITGGGVFRVINPLLLRDMFPIWNKTATRQGSGGVQPTHDLPATLPSLTANTTLPPLAMFQ